jgi:hypothetical protein
LLSGDDATRRRGGGGKSSDLAVLREVPPPLDPPHQALDETDEVTSLVDVAFLAVQVAEEESEPRNPQAHLVGVGLLRRRTVDGLSDNDEPVVDAPARSERSDAVRETVLELLRDEIRDLKHVPLTRTGLVRRSEDMDEALVLIDEPVLLQVAMEKGQSSRRKGRGKRRRTPTPPLPCQSQTPPRALTNPQLASGK